MRPSMFPIGALAMVDVVTEDSQGDRFGGACGHRNCEKGKKKQETHDFGLMVYRHDSVCAVMHASRV